MGDNMFLVLAIALVAMMALSIFSQKKRAKQVEAMRSSIEPGDTIITIGGFTGQVVETPEDEYVFECEGTRMRIKRWAVSSTMKKDAVEEKKNEEN